MAERITPKEVLDRLPQFVALMSTMAAFRALGKNVRQVLDTMLTELKPCVDDEAFGSMADDLREIVIDIQSCLDNNLREFRKTYKIAVDATQ
jgi:hypothetical protein